MRRIAFIGAKGGVGKTTSSMLSACVLAKDRRVEVLDLDPQRSACTWAVNAGRVGPELPFPVKPTRAPAMCRFDARTDWVLADSPPGDEYLMAEAIDWADFVVVATRPDKLDVHHLSLPLSLVQARRKRGAVLVTQLRAGTQEAKEIDGEIARMGADVFQTRIPHSVRTSRLSLVRPSARALETSSYEAFVRELEFTMA